jgi:hypothetical protein
MIITHVALWQTTHSGPTFSVAAAARALGHLTPRLDNRAAWVQALGLSRTRSARPPRPTTQLLGPSLAHVRQLTMGICIAQVYSWRVMEPSRMAWLESRRSDDDEGRPSTVFP